jgi:hypothetical protein
MAGTIEAYIRRFREQPPAPPQKRSTPVDVDFWWQRDFHNQKINEEELLSPVSSQSSGSLRAQRYQQSRQDDSDTEDGDGDLTLRFQPPPEDHSLSDFEKRTENLMKKCDNLLSNLPPSLQKSEAKPQSPLEKKVFESDEFPPWVSVDIPSPIRVMPYEEKGTGTALSPIKSSSPPLALGEGNQDEDRNSPDSIESHLLHSQEFHDDDRDSTKTKSREQSDDEGISVPSSDSDTESDISDMEEASVETTDELIKKAERLLCGLADIDPTVLQATPPHPIEASLSTSQPSPSLTLPIPEAFPSRLPKVSPEIINTPTIVDPPAPTHSPLSPTSFQEIGVQTDFHPIELSSHAPVPSVQSVMSSTTTLYISPASSPSHSPVPLDVNETASPLISDPIPVENSLRSQQPTPEGVNPPSDQPSNPLSLPFTSPSELSHALANLRYEDVEPYLADKIVSTLWNRLIVIREQKKAFQRKNQQRRDQREQEW